MGDVVVIIFRVKTPRSLLYLRTSREPMKREPMMPLLKESQSDARVDSDFVIFLRAKTQQSLT